MLDCGCQDLAYFDWFNKHCLESILDYGAKRRSIRNDKRHESIYADNLEEIEKYRHIKNKNDRTSGLHS